MPKYNNLFHYVSLNKLLYLSTYINLYMCDINKWIHWNIEASKIIQNTKNIINISKKTNKELGDYNITNELLCQKFIHTLSDDVTMTDYIKRMCNFIKLVASDNNIKEACMEAEFLILDHYQNLMYNDDLYNNINTIHKDYRKKLSIEESRFLKKILLSYHREGRDMEKVKQKQLNVVKTKIYALEKDIEKTLVDDGKKIGILSTDLIGIPQEIINQLPIVDKEPLKYGISMTADSYNIATSYIDDDIVRKKIEYLFGTKSVENTGRFMELFYLRDYMSRLIGYKNYTDYAVKHLVAKNYKNVKTFLSDLLKNTDHRYCKEIDMLLKLKEKDCKEKKKKFDGVINSWDINYYTTKWKLEYGIDENSIKQFFPFQVTFKNIISIFEEITHLRFDKVSNANVWNKDVNLLEVYDRNNSKVGYIYTDFMHRKNKYMDNKTFDLQIGSQYPSSDDTKELPIVAIVMNLKNNILRHSDIRSIFRLFGHAIHQISNTSRHSIFGGKNIEYDFLEVYGLVYEKMAWEPDILKRIACSNSTGESISSELISKMCKIRNLDVAIRTRQHIMNAYYDQIVHCSEGFTTICKSILAIKDREERGDKIHKSMMDVYSQLHGQIMTTSSKDGKKYDIRFNRGTFIPTSWKHLINGNQSLYYSIIWSEVYSLDIFTKFFEGNSLSKKSHYDFINKVMKDSPEMTTMERVNKFMDRDMLYDGYLYYYDFIPNDIEYSFFFDPNSFENKMIRTDSDNESDDSKESNDSKESGSDYTNRYSEIRESEMSDMIYRKNDNNDNNNDIFIR